MPAPTLPVGVLSLDHVTLIVASLERSRHFYVDILGMRQVERPQFKFPGLWFQLGNQQIHLVQQHERSSPAGLPAPPENATPGGAFHFAFEVADCQVAIDAMIAAGVTFRGGPSLRPDGCIQSFWFDPDGHVVEVFSRG